MNYVESERGLPLTGLFARQQSYGRYGRQPHGSELEFFKANRHVAGMAADDNRVVLNPFSDIKEDEMKQVYLNELARILMRTGAIERPQYGLTDEQNSFFSGINGGEPYGSGQDIRETLAARLLSGDPSAGRATMDQTSYVEKLRRVLGEMAW